MTAPRTVTAFERRIRRIPVHKRDQVQWSTGEQAAGGVVYRDLKAWLLAKDAGIANEVRLESERADAFLEWWADEYRRYGRRVSDGIAALYWRWYHSTPARPDLDREKYADFRTAMAEEWSGEWLDGEWQAASTLVMEYIWLGQGDWVLQAHLVEAIAEFEEYWAAGRFLDWRRRKRRRTAAARRKSIKTLYEQALLTEIPTVEALLTPAAPAGKSRRRSHRAP